MMFHAASRYGDQRSGRSQARALSDRQKPLNLDLRCREQRRGRRRRYREGGVLHEQLGGKPAHPTKELPEPPAPDEVKVPLDQQPGHHLRVAGSGGVLDRLLHEPVCATPSRRTAAQLARGLAPELELQNLTEQMVVAIPLPARVERDQEHIRAREVREHRNRVLAPENRVAQVRCEAPKHRRAHEEVLGVWCERRQNLVGRDSRQRDVRCPRTPARPRSGS